MNVLLISTADNGGAGLCAYRIHKALQSVGIESKMLVLEKTVEDTDVVRTGHLKMLIYKAANKALRIFGLEITEFNKIFNLCRNEGVCYTSPHSVLRIDKHPLVEWADIIHLHWVNRMIDYPSFFKKTNKPVVWTLHDENLFYGMAHYKNAVIKDDPLESRFKKEKFRYVCNAHRLGIVFLSKMMYAQYSEEPIIRKAQKTIIHNSVDFNVFHPYDKSMSRQKYGIPQNAVVFAFVAAGINDPRKGLEKLIAALQEINIKEAMILAIGKKHGKSYPLVKSIGPVASGATLAELYSCADYFVMPSKQEAFAQTPLEAMSCGLPAVVYPVSGTEELITQENGVRCKGFTVSALVEGIHTAMQTSYDGNTIREYIVRRFSPKEIARQYIEYYKKIANQ